MAKSLIKHMREGTSPDQRAPDGYLVSGYRVVRKGGLIKFNHGWYAPQDDETERRMKAQVGMKLHCSLNEWTGQSIDVGCLGGTAWIRDNDLVLTLWAVDRRTEICGSCHGVTHPDESACIHCGVTKAWANTPEAIQRYAHHQQ